MEVVDSAGEIILVIFEISVDGLHPGLDFRVFRDIPENPEGLEEALIF